MKFLTEKVFVRNQSCIFFYLKTQLVPPVSDFCLWCVWLLPHWGRNKMVTICRHHFQIHFVEWKSFFFIQMSLKFVPGGPVYNKSKLVQVMACHRVIISWTNVDQVACCHVVSLSHSELIWLEWHLCAHYMWTCQLEHRSHDQQVTWPAWTQDQTSYCNRPIMKVIWHPENKVYICKKMNPRIVWISFKKISFHLYHCFFLFKMDLFANSIFSASTPGHTFYRTWAVIILCVHPANERWRYIVTSSLIGWVHTQNDPCWRRS